VEEQVKCDEYRLEIFSKTIFKSERMLHIHFVERSNQNSLSNRVEEGVVVLGGCCDC
jgi:hypothetical protein